MSIKIKSKKSQSNEWKPNAYFETNVAGTRYSVLQVNRLIWHVKEALKEAETTVGNKSLTMEELKRIIEEKVMQKLSPYQDIDSVRYHFSERVIEDINELGNVNTSRTYLDAVDTLIVSIAKGPQVQFNVYADYTITKSGDKKYVTNFKIKDVELIAIFF
jgi:hypothetical protein